MYKDNTKLNPTQLVARPSDASTAKHHISQRPMTKTTTNNSKRNRNGDNPPYSD